MSNLLYKANISYAKICFKPMLVTLALSKTKNDQFMELQKNH